MLLRQLEYLTALAREGHFGRAAAASYVSQPALSAGIQKLEDELGVQIVQRGQRFEGFTPEGLEVLEWARRILAEREQLGHTLDTMRQGLTGVLRIGAIPTALTVSPMLTTAMRAEHPMVRFCLESMSSRDITTKLNDFDIDIGMTYVDGEPLGRARVVPLYEERYYFLTPRRDDLAGRDSISWAEAAAAPLCLLTSTMQNRRILDGYFAEAGATARPVLETDTISAIYAHVVSMRLASVIPHTWLAGFGVPDGARLLPLPPPSRTFHVGLVLAAHQPESMLARAFVDVARSIDLRRELDRATAAPLRAATRADVADNHE